MEGTDGEVALLFLPPHTPQHNPIEMLWREIKKAISNTYFDGEDEMKERIARLVGEGGIPRIRLLWYMREAVCSAEGARPASFPAPDPSPNRTPVESPCRKGRPRYRLALQKPGPSSVLALRLPHGPAERGHRPHVRKRKDVPNRLRLGGMLRKSFHLHHDKSICQ